MKQCAWCKKVKDEKQFYRDRTRKDGLHSYCKECFKKPVDKERRKAYEREYWSRPENKERAQKRRRKAWLKGKEKQHKRRQERYNDPDFRILQRLYGYKRRARQRPFLVTKEELKILIQQAEFCFYCKCKLGDFEIEHKTPLSRGGEHRIENMVIACGSCNRRKGTKTAEEYLAYLQRSEV